MIFRIVIYPGLTNWKNSKLWPWTFNFFDQLAWLIEKIENQNLWFSKFLHHLDCISGKVRICDLGLFNFFDQLAWLIEKVENRNLWFFKFFSHVDCISVSVRNCDLGLFNFSISMQTFHFFRSAGLADRKNWKPKFVTPRIPAPPGLNTSNWSNSKL